ncbi:ImmA/IrrE family metallo-endopeptidase [Oleiagrimonas sp. MCCC 1A03011]|uniref:ImmA/IrrE family metallo-endopeptidase n=1 Tax=Oleiagrimonas sp. MCCC 1A03011 TaxID=1926883 RepID=UPI000DC4062B|nr:ImmA/IrrE family metallo-endopeptidase [Oleiagrimonas sp. MCCC 1A03011]RAP56862.1 DNA-binding protein [Oleiagrimonas sp. MCCC 1A03011]
MDRVAVSLDMFRWARERAGMDSYALATRFPNLEAWEAGEVQPTLRQLEQFAKATHAPVGYFFLPAPPEEPVPIPDFRTIANRPIARPSPNLLDTIYICQQRQDWYREDARATAELPLPFVGSLSMTEAPEEAANHIRETLGFSVEARRECPTWTEALRTFIAQADKVGVMVMVSGVVLNNNRRHLDPQEFRGFALSDPLAPLIFINGADSKAAQMFTLAHELAHLWLGQTALSDVSVDAQPDNSTEAWCNQVAAELLVPMAIFRAELTDNESVTDTMKRLARSFKVSSLVILRRLLDAGRVSREAFFVAYREELARIQEIDARGGGGGDFYRTTAARVSKRFARSLVSSTLEGRTLYRDAFRMLGIAKTTTFNELGRSLGMPT